MLQGLCNTSYIDPVAGDSVPQNEKLFNAQDADLVALAVRDQVPRDKKGFAYPVDYGFPPIVEVLAYGRWAIAMVDSGACNVLVKESVVPRTATVYQSKTLTAADGAAITTHGLVQLPLAIGGELFFPWANIVPKICCNADVLVGMDVLNKFSAVRLEGGHVYTRLHPCDGWVHLAIKGEKSSGIHRMIWEASRNDCEESSDSEGSIEPQKSPKRLMPASKGSEPSTDLNVLEGGGGSPTLISPGPAGEARTGGRAKHPRKRRCEGRRQRLGSFTPQLASEAEEASLANSPAGATHKASSKDAKSIVIDDCDFIAEFNGSHWIARWKWTEGAKPILRNQKGEYQSARRPDLRLKYEAEVDSWVDKGWLRPWNGPQRGVIPLMAVNQPSKAKVRPVMDYRELNEFVECHTGDDEIAVCAEKLRAWRRVGGKITLVDLKSAYLQIHVDETLWPYQLVKYKGTTWALTRLGFGLSCAPRIMTKILGKVLSMDPVVKAGADHYIDDIYVSEDLVSSAKVIEHLKCYGFESKAPEPLNNGGRVLGLQLTPDRAGQLRFSRGKPLPNEIPEGVVVSRRELFSICGQLVGHYPVAGWLQPACSYVKRIAGGSSWNDPIGNDAMVLVCDLVHRAHMDDPVQGYWTVPKTNKCCVWTDASSLAMGVVLEIAGNVVEDNAWLRKKGDVLHINVAELEAVSRGINLALAWDCKEIEVLTDSKTVVAWLQSIITEDKRIKTKGAAEMLVRRRIQVLKEVIAEYHLKMSVGFVTSAENRADSLTRVKQSWLKLHQGGEERIVAALSTRQGMMQDVIERAHLPHHLGCERTFYFAQKICPCIDVRDVRKYISECEPCQSIDPALTGERTPQGELEVQATWHRVAMDVTHHKGNLYLTLVDCGPSRFTIWRHLRRETALSVVKQLEQIVLERGPMKELLMDNSQTFRSGEVDQFLTKWGIVKRFRAVDRPSGNGIDERCHRTVKRIAARGQITLQEAAFWYNASPRTGQDSGSVPGNSAYRHEMRHPAVTQGGNLNDVPETKFKVGDFVWFKPRGARCDTKWSPGEVTGIVSPWNFEINGMPRHVNDLRKRRRGRSVFQPEVERDFENQQEGDHISEMPEFLNEAEPCPGGHVVIHNTQVHNEPEVEDQQEAVQVEQLQDLEDETVSISSGEDIASEYSDAHDVPPQDPLLRRSTRTRRRPEWGSEYEVDWGATQESDNE